MRFLYLPEVMRIFERAGDKEIRRYDQRKKKCSTVSWLQK
jgi:hypothetical protein